MEPLEVLRERFPALELRSVRAVETGWDSFVLEVNGEYVFRFPRRPEVADWIEREVRLLPELAKALPVAVPRFEHVARNGLLCVGYRKIRGEPATDLGASGGEGLGRFLLTLHRFPVERARSCGLPYFDPASWRARLESFAADLRARVLQLLTASEQQAAERLFAQIGGLDFEPALVHGDLGPDHVLVEDGRLSGVIDWSDACVSDPALDLSWCLHGTSAAAADAVARAYGVDGVMRERSLFYRRLAPWHEVVYGLDAGRPAFVESGIGGVRSRLPS